MPIRIIVLWAISLIGYYVPRLWIFPLFKLDFMTWHGLAVYHKLTYLGLLFTILAYVIILFSFIPFKYLKSKTAVAIICLLEGYTFLEYLLRTYLFIENKPITSLNIDLCYNLIFVVLLGTVVSYLYFLIRPMKFDPFDKTKTQILFTPPKNHTAFYLSFLAPIFTIIHFRKFKKHGLTIYAGRHMGLSQDGKFTYPSKSKGKIIEKDFITEKIIAKAEGFVTIGRLEDHIIAKFKSSLYDKYRFIYLLRDCHYFIRLVLEAIYENNND